MKGQLFLYLTIFVFFNHALYAYRPFATEDAGVAHLGENKIELGYEAAGIHANSIDSNNFAFLVGIGLGKAELMIESPYCINSNEEGEDKGLQDVGIAGKIRVAGKDDAGVVLKTEYMYRSDMYSLSTAVSYSFGLGLVHIQAGWMSNFDNDGFFGGLGFDFSVIKGFNIIIDFFSEYFNKATYYQALGGVIIPLIDRVAFDAAMGCCWMDRWSNERNVIATAGLSVIM
ncbi:MAG: hypothetical protein N3F66_02735 [Spirochaetes bacterium]|nr:hypothetical protein [Spirochaetota bacterium]